MNETPISFRCEGKWLYGLVHDAGPGAHRGVLVLAGGPQYRVGSHRQFTLLARHLAAHGIPVMRFDYHGMGDSDGEPGAPEPCEHLAADIRAALDAFCTACPQLREVVLWGLCDGASAAFMYGADDARVVGIIAVNPWVVTDRTPAQSYLRHYYLARLSSPAFWKKAARGGVKLHAALQSLWDTVKAAAAGTRARRAAGPSSAAAPGPSITEKMTAGLAAFRGRVMVVLSGNDRVAAEFKETARKSRRLRRALKARRTRWHEHARADHTFSRREWRDQVAAWSAEWLKSW